MGCCLNTSQTGSILPHRSHQQNQKKQDPLVNHCPALASLLWLIILKVGLYCFLIGKQPKIVPLNRCIFLLHLLPPCSYFACSFVSLHSCCRATWSVCKGIMVVALLPLCLLLLFVLLYLPLRSFLSFKVCFFQTNNNTMDLIIIQLETEIKTGLK